MSRIKLAAMALAAAVVFAAAVSTTAFAATEGWMVNGTMLSGSKKLMTTGKITHNLIVAGFGLEIECTSPEIEAAGSEISAPNKGKAASLIFRICEVTTGNPPCSLGTKTIGTRPLLITEITLDGALAVKASFIPHGGTIATLRYEGATCALLGEQFIIGKIRLLARLGQDEKTWQPILMFTTPGDLSLGGKEVSLIGEVELATENLAPWSFL